MKKTTSLLIAIAVSSVAMGAGWGDDIYTGSAFAGFEAGYAKPKVQIYGVNGRSDDSGKSSYFGARLGSYWSNTTRAYFSLSYIRQDDAHLKYNNPTTAGGTPSPAPPSPAPPASGNSTSAANAVGYSTPQPNSNAITYNNINIGHPPTSTVTPAINVPYAVPYPTPGAIPPLAASQLPPSYTSTSIPGPDTRANSNTDDYTIHAIKQLNLLVSTDYLFMPEREYHPFVGLTLGATQTKARGSSLPTTVSVEANGRFEKNWTLSYGAQAGVIYQIDNIDLEAGLKYLTNHSSNHYDHKHDVRLKVNDSRQIYAAASIRF